MEDTKVAKFTHEGKQYVGKRKVKMYDDKSKVDTQLIDDANVGLTLRVQRSIRESLKVKHNIKAVSVAGEAKDLSTIEEV